MRKPCWGWNDPSIEEVRMAAFHVRGSRCWLVGLMLSWMSRACELMGHHQGSTSSPLTLHLAHLRGAEIWNQIIKIRDERESLRRQNMYSQTPPLAHVQFIPHTQVLWLELQKHTLQQCSGYIFRSNASQYSPAEESALILQASCALVGCSSVLCDWKRELSLCLKICLCCFCSKSQFLLSDATEWKTFIFFGRGKGAHQDASHATLSKSEEMRHAVGN